MSTPSAERNDPKATDKPQRSKDASHPSSPKESSPEKSSEKSSPEGSDSGEATRPSATRSSKQRASVWLGENPPQPQKVHFEEVRKREEQFRVLEEETAEYGIALLGPEGRIEHWSRGARCLTGYSEKEALGRTLSLFYSREEVEAGVPESALDEASLEGSFSQTGWRMRKDGNRLWAKETIRAISREKGNPQGYAWVLRDLTSRRRLKQEALRVQEKEWERLKDDLHDIAGSQLTGANLLVEQARQEVERQKTEGRKTEGRKTEGPEAEGKGLADRLQKIKSLIVEASEALQRISRRLTPNGLSKGGLSKGGLSKANLEEALKRLAKETEGASFEVGSLEPGENSVDSFSEKTLSEEEAKQLYWIAREAIAGARHQERSEKALLRLTKETGGLVLLIKEEGGNLHPLENKLLEANASEGAPTKRDASERDASENDISKHEKAPIPLRVMRRRAELLGAEIKAEAAPAGGTRIRCHLPA